VKCNKYLIIVGKCSIINTCNKSAEPGQNRNIAALTFNFYVHIFFGVIMKDRFINFALDEAKIAFNLNEVPVGAVIVRNGEVIAKAHNLKRSTNNIMNHAEIVAIMEASGYIGDWRLNDCEMYITLEPCPMCAGAISQSRIKKIYIGCESNIKSNKELIKNILQNKDGDSFVEIEYLNNKDCSQILTQFFSSKR